MEAEDRIMIAVEKVGKKVDDLRNTTGEFQLATSVAIAKIQQIEASCPIAAIQETLTEVKATSDQNKKDMSRIAVFIGGGVGVLVTAAGAVMQWFRVDG